MENDDKSPLGSEINEKGIEDMLGQTTSLLNNYLGQLQDLSKNQDTDSADLDANKEFKGLQDALGQMTKFMGNIEETLRTEMSGQLPNPAEAKEAVPDASHDFEELKKYIKVLRIKNRKLEESVEKIHQRLDKLEGNR